MISKQIVFLYTFFLKDNRKNGALMRETIRRGDEVDKPSRQDKLTRETTIQAMITEWYIRLIRRVGFLLIM